MESRTEDRLLGTEKDDTAGKLRERIWAETKKLWRVAFPSIISRVAAFGFLIATQSFMGHIGETELTSYALVLNILVRFINGLLLGMVSALETLCGQAFGAKQYHMMGIYLQRSWVVLFVTSVILYPFFIFSGPIFRLLGQEEELSRVAGKIALWFLPFIYYFAFTMTMQMFLQAQLKNMIIGWLSGASFILHLILSWLFVYKLNLGIPGAMGAMIISTWSMVTGELLYVFGGWCPQTWRGFSKSAFSELWPVVKLSLSSGVMLCLNITTWEFMVSLGFLSSASVRVANELGRGDAKAAVFSIKVNLCTSLCIGLFFWVLALVFGHVISYAFTSSTEVAKAVSSLSVLLAFSILLNSIQPVLSGVAIGAGWQAIVAYVNLSCYYVVGVPVGIVLGYVAGLQVRGIWIGMICGVALQTLVLIFITWKTNWNDQVKKAHERLNRWLLEPSEESNENTSP
uniref:Protein DETOXIFICATION n=1 Tax=Nelumbo nucifera TaxID=4432 RepID=A0A823A2N0_NELNU|nr:TPA_asm: hypothetical protein HUJ06_018285 [Nelumbo nucifera]